MDPECGPGRFSAVYECSGVAPDESAEGGARQRAYLTRDYGGLTLAGVAFEFGPDPDGGRGVRLQAGRRYRITVEEVTE